MISRCAAYFSDHPFFKHLLFLLLAVITVWINGYHFGTFDQVAHISFLKKTIDPELYPNDPFLGLRNYHFSYFWDLFIPLSKAGLLEESMFLVHLLTVYGTFWMFWALSDLLFSDARANLLITLALIFPHLGFPGFQIIEFSLLNRTFALPFILGSIWLYLKDRRILAYLMLGLMFNIHAVYVVFVLCMYLLNEILSFGSAQLGRLAAGLGAFIISSLPVLLWRSQTGSGIDFTLRPDLLSLASRSLLYTVYYPIGPFNFMIGNFLAGVGSVWAFILGYRQAPPSLQHRTMKNFMIAIGILLLVAVIVSYFLPITILLQFQILRAGVFMLYFGMLYLSYFLSSKGQQGELGKPGLLVLGLSFVILITPLVTILLWLLFKAIIHNRTRIEWLVPVILAVEVVTVIIGLRSGLLSPGFHIFGPESDWQDVQIWAKDNTPTDAKFITPPHYFGHYTPDWRVFSERSPFATISEFLTIQLDPDYADDLVHRFQIIAPGAVAAFNGNYMRSIELSEEKFYTNTSADFIEMACRYSLDYLVVEQDHPYPFEERYRNQGFILYQLPQCPADRSSYSGNQFHVKTE